MVLAFPNASRMGLACSSCFSRSPYSPYKRYHIFSQIFSRAFVNLDCRGPRLLLEAGLYKKQTFETFLDLICYERNTLIDIGKGGAGFYYHIIITNTHTHLQNRAAECWKQNVCTAKVMEHIMFSVHRLRHLSEDIQSLLFCVYETVSVHMSANKYTHHNWDFCH